MLADELLEIFFKWREVTEGGIELIERVAFILRGKSFCVGRVEGREVASIYSVFSRKSVVELFMLCCADRLECLADKGGGHAARICEKLAQTTVIYLKLEPIRRIDNLLRSVERGKSGIGVIIVLHPVFRTGYGGFKELSQVVEKL